MIILSSDQEVVIMKRKINVWEYAPQILEAVGKGVLVTTKADGVVDTMTIGWGTLGIEWGKPIFTVFVRESRYTKALLDKNPEFTINVPLGDCDKNIISVCGTKSGRDIDKFAELALTPEAPEVISVPGIRELPLTLECKVIYRQQQTPQCVLDDHIYTHYEHPCPDIEQDYHTAYYGQIVSAYIIE